MGFVRACGPREAELPLPGADSEDANAFCLKEPIGITPDIRKRKNRPARAAPGSVWRRGSRSESYFATRTSDMLGLAKRVARTAAVEALQRCHSSSTIYRSCPVAG